MKTIYIAEFSWGKGALAKASLVKETGKMMHIENPEMIIGWMYLPNRLSKEKYHCFFTMRDSFKYLINTAALHIAKLKKDEKAIVDEIENLQTLGNKLLDN